MVLVDDGHRPDDALGQGGDAGGGEGTVPEELGRLAGVGEAAGSAVVGRVPLLISELRSGGRQAPPGCSLAVYCQI